MKRSAAAILAAALAGCTPSAPARAPASPVTSAPHLQILRRLTDAQRRAVFDGFTKRNAGAWAWEGPAQVDAFLGHLVAAHREDPPGARRAVPLDDAALDTVATTFLAKNADLLGLAAADLPRIDVEVPPGAGETRLVLARAELPRRGYLAFASVTSNLRVLLTVGPDGEVRSIANASAMHPPLRLGLDPRLGPEDPRLVRHVVGRRVFALVASPEIAAALAPDVRLPRVELGEVRPDDVRRVRLDIHVSEGPMAAWRSYRLVWVVEVMKRRPDPETAAFFTFVVDADTGEIVQDARVPILDVDPEVP